MTGLGLLLVAAGAIMRFAVADSIEGVDLSAVGVILMGVGAVAFIVGLFRPSTHTVSERHVSADGRHVVEESTSVDAS